MQSIKLAHIADIHIQDRRRPEYEAVFSTLYRSLFAEKPDIIVIAGDVFDSKLRSSPNNQMDVGKFLKNLADIAPVVMIPGNHDVNVLTPGAMDLLTPIVHNNQDLQPPRLTYWRNSGVYEVHGIQWTVIAPDGPVDPLKSEAPNNSMPRVCLFHEEVNGGLMPSGLEMREHRISIGDFAPFDAALGGHIHLRQTWKTTVNPARRAGYCGSLIQQNIGETHNGHGYLLWTLTPSKDHAPYRTSPPEIKPVDIRNEIGYLRIEVAANVDITPQPLPMHVHYWEVVYDARSTRETAVAIAKKISPKYQGSDPRFVRPKDTPEEGVTAAPQADLMAVQAEAQLLETHTEIIKQILGADFKHLNAVLEMHRTHYEENEILPLAASRARIRLKKLEFDNMYRYGAGNIVDFTRLERCVSGVIAPNYSGKSSLIDVLLYALYDKHPRTGYKSDIVHLGAPSYRLVLEFEIDGKPGKIIKGNFRESNDKNSKYRLEYGDDPILTGVTETNKAAERLFGTAEAALKTSFMLQDSAENNNLVVGNGKTRKDILSSILRIGSFEKILDEIKTKITAAKKNVKEFGRQPGAQTLEEIERELAKHQAVLDKAKHDEQCATTSLANLQKNLSNTMKKLYDAVGNMRKYEAHYSDLPKSTTAVNTLNSLLAEAKIKTVEDAEAELAKWGTGRSQGMTLEWTPTREEAETALNAIREFRSSEENLETQINTLREDMQSRAKIPERMASNLQHMSQPQVEQLAAYRGVPLSEAKCQYDEAIAGQALQRIIPNLIDSCPGCQQVLELLSETNVEACTKALRTVEKVEYAKTFLIEQRLAKAIAHKAELKAKAQAAGPIVRTRIAKLDKIKEAIKNQELESRREAMSDMCEKSKQMHAAIFNEVNTLEQTIQNERDALSASSKIQMAARENIASLKGRQKTETTREEKLRQAIEEFEILQAYQTVLRPKDGIGHILLKKARQDLEKSINTLLTEMGAAFVIELTENFDLLHGPQGGKLLPISLASGYQRCSTSLAARIAMWHLAAIPLPDCLIMDEGFAACDEENLEAMATAIEALSRAPSAPRLVFVVSHLEVLKARIEKALVITRTAKSSRIQNAEDTALAPVEDLAILPIQPVTPDQDQPLVQDPNNPSKMWCELCRASLAPAYARKHGETKKHRQALERAGGR